MYTVPGRHIITANPATLAMVSVKVPDSMAMQDPAIEHRYQISGRRAAVIELAKKIQAADFDGLVHIRTFRPVTDPARGQAHFLVSGYPVVSDTVGLSAGPSSELHDAVGGIPGVGMPPSSATIGGGRGVRNQAQHPGLSSAATKPQEATLEGLFGTGPEVDEVRSYILCIVKDRDSHACVGPGSRGIVEHAVLPAFIPSCMPF